jgi:hypothetical protein
MAEYAMRSPLHPQFPNPFGLVDTRQDPGGPGYKKLIIRIQTLSSVAPGTQLNLGIAGEVKVFADAPLFLRLGQTPLESPMLTELTFLGRVENLFLRRNVSIPEVGRVVVYVGMPYLGVNWQREDPLKKGVWMLAQGSVVWNAGLITFDYSAMVLSSANEANYLISVDALREGGGTIETLEFVENETGLSFVMLHERIEPPNDKMNFRPPHPYRIPASGFFRFTGSNEAVNTNVRVVSTWCTI